jgi:hypothetical protein
MVSDALVTSRSSSFTACSGFDSDLPPLLYPACAAGPASFTQLRFEPKRGSFLSAS